MDVLIGGPADPERTESVRDRVAARFGEGRPGPALPLGDGHGPRRGSGRRRPGTETPVCPGPRAVPSSRFRLMRVAPGADGYRAFAVGRTGAAPRVGPAQGLEDLSCRTASLG
ncbi:hypothetical protein DKG34_06900 [Streptomyces sp. NWU49]|nr:hypothetical protein DKG34_06900 [Streptomyces sp. NWU49]